MRLVDLAYAAAQPALFREPAAREAAEAAPGAGSTLRWGRPSTFAYSSAERASGQGRSVTVEYPDRRPAQYMRLLQSELKVKATRVRVEDPDNADTWVDVDRLETMYFHFTELPEKPHPSLPQGTLTTYYIMEFSQQPPEGVEQEAPA